MNIELNRRLQKGKICRFLEDKKLLYLCKLSKHKNHEKTSVHNSTFFFYRTSFL